LKRAGQQPKKRASARAARRPRPARPRPISLALHYQAIIESSDDAILSKDLHGVILSWNQGAERLFGFTPEEAVGRPVTIIIPLDRLDEEPAILEKIHRGERIEHFETVRQRKDGSLVDISLTISPIRNSRGKIVGASKIGRDITELRKARDRQHLLMREMSHRVKNLFALSGSIVGLSARSAKSPQSLRNLPARAFPRWREPTLSRSRTTSMTPRTSRRRFSRSSARSLLPSTNPRTRASRSRELTLEYPARLLPASPCCCMNSQPMRPNMALSLQRRER
jgi:PAS domain S-box-containing protein